MVRMELATIRKHVQCRRRLDTLGSIILLLTSLISEIVSSSSAQGLASTPPRGWNSYDSFSWIISESEFLDNAEFVANTLKPFGYEYVVVDFLWYRKRDPKASIWSPGFDLTDEWGRPVPDPVRWPSTAGGKGFGPIADKVHAMGLKFGLHVMRGISTSAIAKNTPILGAKGSPDGSGERLWRAQDIALRDRPCFWMPSCFVSVNTSSEGGKAFIESLYQQYASWKVDFIKHDCVFGAEDMSLDEIEAVSQAIVNTGRPIVYSLSPGVRATTAMGFDVHKLSHMYRVTSDDWDFWNDVQSHFDVARDFAAVGLVGASGLQEGRSWPDLDMLPLGWLTDPGAPYGPYRRCRLSSDEQKLQVHSGPAPDNEAPPVLRLVGCNETINTRWAVHQKFLGSNNEQLCWTVPDVSFSSGTRTRELNGCFEGPLSRDPCTEFLRNAKKVNVPYLHPDQARSSTKEFETLCGNYWKQWPTTYEIANKEHFVSSSKLIGETWRVTSTGQLIGTKHGLCASIQVQVNVSRIWIARGLSGNVYVAFFNLGLKPSSIAISLDSLVKDQASYSPRKQPGNIILKSGLQCVGLDVWSNKQLGILNGVLSALVPPHGAALFSLTCNYTITDI
ncbi:hypothetical protein O6H91_22G015700 [Diphasiastrum complanatum]|uniref:Uncharacterized protein n=1 Tax=Diphasiastrum complanatum TaxID=34168 RepID=A0ACC2ADA4_DIPCM|nr:hypothetical protein O6H91_22G015700 [Diphasiastrum complanatum]